MIKTIKYKILYFVMFLAITSSQTLNSNNTMYYGKFNDWQQFNDNGIHVNITFNDLGLS